MNQKRLGRQTVSLERPPALIGWAAVAGQKEQKGPLGALFSAISEDDTFGEPSWEKAESARRAGTAERKRARRRMVPFCGGPV